MHLLDNGTQTASLGAPQSAVGTPGYAVTGIPGGFAPSVFDPDMGNTLIEEFRQIVAAPGIALDRTNNAQAIQAIRQLAGANVSAVSATPGSPLTADAAGLVIVNATAGAISLTLPAAAAANGVPLSFTFVRSDATGNAVSIGLHAGDTWLTGGSAVLVVPASGITTVQGDGTSRWAGMQALAHTWTGAQTFAAGLALPNNVTITAKDSGGTSHNLIGYLSDNFMHIYGGTAGGVVSNSAGTANNLYWDDPGNLTVRGKLRADVGARGSGDMSAAAILSDFSRVFIPNYGYTEGPDGTIDQTIAAAVYCSGSGEVDTYVTLPIAFPTGPLDAVISFDGTGPPLNVAISVGPTSASQVKVSTNSSGFAGYAGVVIRARGY